MRRIFLENVLAYAIVDDDDFEAISKFHWHGLRVGKMVYANRMARVDEAKSWRIRGNRYVVTMHRSVMGLSRGDGKEVDHINRNSLDNQKSNLRLCTKAQNKWNADPPNRRKTSKYKGVSFSKNASSKKWQAFITVNLNHIWLGRFMTEREAAKAYDKAAAVHYGEFAKLNFARRPECKGEGKVGK